MENLLKYLLSPGVEIKSIIELKSEYKVEYISNDLYFIQCFESIKSIEQNSTFGNLEIESTIRKNDFKFTSRNQNEIIEFKEYEVTFFVEYWINKHDGAKGIESVYILEGKGNLYITKSGEVEVKQTELVPVNLGELHYYEKAFNFTFESHLF